MPSGWCLGDAMVRTAEVALAAAAAVLPGEALVEELLGETPSGAEGGAAAEGAEAVELDEDVAEEKAEVP
eukprot:1473452-Amphidinium_carterae.1